MDKEYLAKLCDARDTLCGFCGVDDCEKCIVTHLVNDAKLTEIAREILAIEADLPFRFDYSKGRRPSIDDFDLYTFEQTWGSTALGFGGIGGQAMTTARTYVFIPLSRDEKCFVYFAGRFAYAAPYGREFMDDVSGGNMASVPMHGKYMKG